MATKEYFPGIGKIKFEGVESKNPMNSLCLTELQPIKTRLSLSCRSVKTKPMLTSAHTTEIL